LGDYLAVFPGVDAASKHLASILAALPRKGERHVRVNAQRQTFLFPIESVFQAPPPAVLG